MKKGNIALLGFASLILASGAYSTSKYFTRPPKIVQEFSGIIPGTKDDPLQRQLYEQENITPEIRSCASQLFPDATSSDREAFLTNQREVYQAIRAINSINNSIKKIDTFDFKARFNAQKDLKEARDEAKYYLDLLEEAHISLDPSNREHLTQAYSDLFERLIPPK